MGDEKSEESIGCCGAIGLAIYTIIGLIVFMHSDFSFLAAIFWPIWIIMQIF
jgi:hypothetical protein